MNILFYIQNNFLLKFIAS